MRLVFSKCHKTYWSVDFLIFKVYTNIRLDKNPFRNTYLKTQIFKFVSDSAKFRFKDRYFVRR